MRTRNVSRVLLDLFSGHEVLLFSTKLPVWSRLCTGPMKATQTSVMFLESSDGRTENILE